MKHCYIRLDQDLCVLYNERFIEVMLCEDDEGDLMCHLSGPDDWELSYTGADAELKFNALLDVSGDVSYNYILQLGFTQYG
jgi:hypothetical protein